MHARVLPFAEAAEASRVAEAVELLTGLGYRVTPPPPGAAPVSKIADIIELFYATMAHYHPSRKMHYASSAADRQVIASLLTSRQSTGLSRKRAYAEVCSIIRTLFKYESTFGFESPIASVRILSSSWVIDRVLALLNGEDRAEEDAAFDRVSSSFSSRHTKSPEYLEETGRQLNSMYERLVKNGSKTVQQKHTNGVPHPKGGRSNR